MSTLLKRKFLDYGIFVLGTYLLECISFAFMGWGFFPVYFLLDLFVLLIIGTPIFFFKNTLFDQIYLGLLMLIFTFLFCLNANYYISTGTIFSFQDFRWAIKGLGALTGALSYVYAPVFITEGLIAVLFIAIIIFINNRFKIKRDKKKSHKTILTISIIAMVFGLATYPTSLYLTSSYEKSVNNNITANQVNLSKNLNYQNLGMLSYYLKDIDCMFFTHNIYSVDEIKEFSKAGKPNTNDFTGKLKGYNVITIMVETGISQMVNETLTPNLWQLTQDGINCTNNYSKNKTQISEYIGIVGNYTTNSVDTNYKYAMPFSLPNAIGDYHTMFFHDVAFAQDVYERYRLMPKLGFENTYLHKYLYPKKPGWNWHSYSFDSETTDKVINFIDQTPTDKPFFAFYTTLTMHGPYNRDGSNKAYYQKLDDDYGAKLREAKNQGLWNNPLANTINESSLDNFMLKTMDFDKGLGNLMTYLNNSGKKDNTLLVLYGDHDIYYPGKNGKRLSQEIYHEKDLHNIKLYRTLLTFYNPTLNALYEDKYAGSHEFTAFTSPECIVPTILDLLGQKYSTNLYLSDSIFNYTDPYAQLMYSFEFGAFLNDHYYTQTVNKVSKIYDDNNTKDTFLNSTSLLMDKLLHFASIYADNIFKGQNYSDFLPD